MSNKTPRFFQRLAQKVCANSGSGRIDTRGASSQAKNAADAALAEERRRQAATNSGKR